MANTKIKQRKQSLSKDVVKPSDCVHPITYATHTKFCPRKCLLCGKYIEQTEI